MSLKKDKKNTEGSENKALSWPKRVLFYFSASVLIPFALLAVTEMILRLTSAGYQTDFLIRTKIQNQSVWVDNPDFGRRFFPEGITRSPNRLAVPCVKDAGEFRVVILGASAAQGDPDPSFGFSRILDIMISKTLPDKKVRMINAAVTAINSHVVLQIAEEIKKLQPDLVIIYLGNNEVVGPFGAGTVFHHFSMNRNLISAGLWIRKFHAGQMISRLLNRSGTQKCSGQWKGMAMFLGNQVVREDPRLEKVYTNFKSNLVAICTVLSKQTPHLLLSTLAVNLEDSPPFAGIADSTATLAARWFEQGESRFKEKNPAAAYDFYLKAIEADSGNANLYFRAAQCALAMKQVHEAECYFLRALDLDALRFRADPQINTIITQVADQHHLPLVDVNQAIQAASKNGIPGNDFFYEHVHFNFIGNYMAARTFFEAFQKQPQNPLQDIPAVSFRESQTALAYTLFNQIDILEQIQKRLSRPPFTNQLDAGKRNRVLQNQIMQMKQSVTREEVDTALQQYQSALKQRPDDRVLIHNYASLLMHLGMNREAEKAYKQVIQHLPHYAQAWNNLGLVFFRLNRQKKALDAFEQALHYDGPSAEVYNNMGMVYSRKKQFTRALRYYDLALEMNPEFAQALTNKGTVLFQKNEIRNAIQLYKKAVQVNPDDAAGHYNLAYGLMQNKQYQEARQHFQEALRLNPRFDAARKQLKALQNY